MVEKEQKEVLDQIFDDKADGIIIQSEKTNDDIVQFKPGEMKFKGLFKKLIRSFESQYSLYSMFEKEPDPYKLKRVILVFTSKKGKSKRLIFQEENNGPEQ